MDTLREAVDVRLAIGVMGVGALGASQAIEGITMDARAIAVNSMEATRALP